MQKQTLLTPCLCAQTFLPDKHEFWIDEFSISRTYRNVTRTSPPQLPNHVRVLPLSVRKQTVNGGVNFVLNVTSEDCKAPLSGLDFEIEVLGADQTVQANVSRIQDHSDQISGNVVVTFNGQAATFDVQSSADEVRLSLLAAFSDVQDLKVIRLGSCQVGYEWFVTFTGKPGDLPTMEVDGTMLKGRGVKVTVQTIEDGMSFVQVCPFCA